MGKSTSDNVQAKPTATDAGSVKAADIKDFYESGAHSVSEVAEHFNVEESDVINVLGLDKDPEPQTPVPDEDPNPAGE